MAHKVFYSFHYDNDWFRVQQVQNMGALEGQTIVSPQRWEEVEAGGDAEIQKWIDRQMADKACNVVLIGSQTASRRWVLYEIRKAWNAGKGVVGIHIHGLKDQDSKTASKGLNPFAYVSHPNGGSLEHHVKAYDPPGSDSQAIYASIKNNLESLVEAAIAARK